MGLLLKLIETQQNSILHLKMAHDQRFCTDFHLQGAPKPLLKARAAM